MPTPETLAQRLRLNSAPRPVSQSSRIAHGPSQGNGHGRKELSLCSRSELLGILSRNEETLKNERLVSVLPDKGQKLKDTINQIRTIISSGETADIDHKLQHISIEPDRKLRKTGSIEGTEEATVSAYNEDAALEEEESSNREQRRRRKSDGGPTDLFPGSETTPSQNYMPGNTVKPYRAVPHQTKEMSLEESVALQTEHRRKVEEAQLRANMARLDITRENPIPPLNSMMAVGKDEGEGSSGEDDTDFSDDSSENESDSEMESEDEEKQYAET